MGFIPIHYHNVLNTYDMLSGMVDKDGKGGSKCCEKITRTQKAMLLIDNINRYNDLAKTAKKVGNHFGRSVVT